MNLRMAARILIFISCPVVSFSQQSTVLGNPCGIMDSTWSDPLNLAENPANATNISSMQCGVFAGRFKDVKGLNFISAVFVIPFKKLVAALAIHHTGSFGYQHNDLNLIMGKDLGAISLGLVFNSNFIAVQTIGGYHTMSVGVGITKISGQLSFGASVRGIGIGGRQELIDQVQRIKLSSQCLFKVSSLVSIAILGSKETGRPVSIQPAIYYRAGIVNFSMGFDSMGNSLYLLAGWQFKACEIKTMLGYQGNLGLLNGAELLFKRTR